MNNDIRNLYWPGIYNVKFVHNCSGSMLEATADLTNRPMTLPTSGRAGQLSRAPNTVLLSKVTLTLGLNNFLVVWIENLSNFKHFHISAMSNNTITADYEFFVNCW